MSKKYEDESIIAIRERLYDHEENIEKVKNKVENDINNGYIIVEGREILFSERVVDEKIRIVIPTDFEKMEDRYIDLKYPAYKAKNKIILTNEQTTINFMFDFTDGEIAMGQLELARDQLLELLQKSKPSLVLLDKSLIKTEYLDISYFEIVTPALDKDIYNFMYFFVLDNKLVMASFNCFDDEKNWWQPIIKQVIETIQIVG